MWNFNYQLFISYLLLTKQKIQCPDFIEYKIVIILNRKDVLKKFELKIN